MTSDDLARELALAAQVLTSNKQMMQPELLAELIAFVNSLRQTTQFPQDFNIDKFLTGLSNALDAERKLIGHEGDILIKVCNELQNRRVILALLARFI